MQRGRTGNDRKPLEIAWRKCRWEGRGCREDAARMDQKLSEIAGKLPWNERKCLHGLETVGNRSRASLGGSEDAAWTDGKSLDKFSVRASKDAAWTDWKPLGGSEDAAWKDRKPLEMALGKLRWRERECSMEKLHEGLELQTAA